MEDLETIKLAPLPSSSSSASASSSSSSFSSSFSSSSSSESESANFPMIDYERIGSMSHMVNIATKAINEHDLMGNSLNGSVPYNPDDIQKTISIVVPIIFAIIVIVGLIGNSLVVIVVKCNPQMCSTTNLLIINLAIADLLFIIFCVPFTAWDYAFTYWPFGNIWCKVVQYLIVVCAYASIYTVSILLFLCIAFYIFKDLNIFPYPISHFINKNRISLHLNQIDIK